MRGATESCTWCEGPALTMPVQDQQVLLCYQQLNSPSLSFPSSSTKASEGTEQRFPPCPQTACLNLVPGSAVSFLYYGFGSLWLSSEEVAHCTKRGFAAKFCNIQSFILEGLGSLFLISCYRDVIETSQLPELFPGHLSWSKEVCSMHWVQALETNKQN